jgi:hypothetical protein
VTNLNVLIAQRIPASRKEYFERKAKLWSLIQSVNPEHADLDAIRAEATALDIYEDRLDLDKFIERRKDVA